VKHHESPRDTADDDEVPSVFIISLLDASKGDISIDSVQTAQQIHHHEYNTQVFISPEHSLSSLQHLKGNLHPVQGNNAIHLMGISTLKQREFTETKHASQQYSSNTNACLCDNWSATEEENIISQESTAEKMTLKSMT
jgi:hypothetical protein